MTDISAAENYTIQTSLNRWRLIQHERPLAEATPNGFRYGNRFGTSRKLNTDGMLNNGQILQVVLGWQQVDEAWHLGLILEPQIADKRGSRWCELVAWPDPDMSVFHDLAEETGRDLAQVLGVEFYLVPPQPTMQTIPPRSLPDLPLSFGLWTMDYVPNEKRRFIIKRSGQWTRQKAFRILWYIFLAVIYALVSVLTLTSKIALPNAGTLLPSPQVLPYLGIGTAVFLVLLALYHLIVMLRTPDQIMVDGEAGTISAWKGRNQRWQVDQQDVQSIYVSEIVKRREEPPATEHGELNLHLGGGKFHFVLVQHEPDDNLKAPQPSYSLERNDDELYELTRDNIYTQLQGAALHIAETLHLTPWYDLRVK